MPVTEKAYRDKIVEQTKALGVYRAEFTRTRSRLARIYVRIEELDGMLRDGDIDLVLADRNGKRTVSPEVAELDRLNDQALAYEKALGMTADSVRKINDQVFAPKEVDPFAAKLAALTRRRA